MSNSVSDMLYQLLKPEFPNTMISHCKVNDVSTTTTTTDVWIVSVNDSFHFSFYANDKSIFFYYDDSRKCEFTNSQDICSDIYELVKKSLKPDNTQKIY